MSTLTIETIKAAQDKDLSATGEVVAAMEQRVANIAYKLGVNADQRDEFAQVGRIAVWDALPRFEGDTVDAFFAFMHKTVDAKIRDAVREEKNQGATGADHGAIKLFALMLKEANGDVDVAERLCQTLPPAGKRLSRERAYAARTAWEGTVSLDIPGGDGEDDWSLADTLVSDYGVPEDLISAADRAADTRDRKIKVVRAVIDSMGAKQAHILKATYGIDPVPCLGRGAEADAELAEALSTTQVSVRNLRTQAHKSFETRYTKVTGMTR